CRQFIPREDAKTRRREDAKRNAGGGGAAGRELAGSMLHTRALLCPAQPGGDFGSSGLPAQR
ncbi:MAG: hypothetical protein ACKPJD_20420, partial [Planctomycetaceae bacterium]